jgi:hypothetical protein
MLQVQCSNMSILAANFPQDNEITRYSAIRAGANPALPQGLSFDSTTGKLTGHFNVSSAGDEFDLIVSATNASGPAENPQTIRLRLYRDTVPLITLTPTALNSTYTITNLETYQSSSPLLTVTSDDTNATQFVLSGTLPKGLLFNSVTGKFTGSVTEVTDGSSALSVVAANSFGVSVTVNFTISWTIFPAISSYPTSPVTVSRYNTYTADSPLLSIAVLGTHTGFNVSGLPTALTLTAEGKVVGTVDAAVVAGARTVTISAYNTHGTSETVSFTLVVPVAVFLNFSP